MSKFSNIKGVATYIMVSTNSKYYVWVSLLIELISILLYTFQIPDTCGGVPKLDTPISATLNCLISP